MKKTLIVAALILGICTTQAAFSVTSYMPNTRKAVQNTKSAVKADVKKQKDQAKKDALKKQQQKAAELKKKQAAKTAKATKAKNDYNATKNDINNIQKRYSK